MVSWVPNASFAVSDMFQVQVDKGSWKVSRAMLGSARPCDAWFDALVLGEPQKALSTENSVLQEARLLQYEGASAQQTSSCWMPSARNPQQRHAQQCAKSSSREGRCSGCSPANAAHSTLVSSRSPHRCKEPTQAQET